MDMYDLMINSKYDFSSSKIITKNIEFPIFAHPDELLFDHSRKTFEVFDKLMDKNLIFHFYSFFHDNNYLQMDFNNFLEILKYFVYFHDIGKISYSFQIERLNRNYNGSFNDNGKYQKEIIENILDDSKNINDFFELNHSLTGALIFLNFLDDKIEIKNNLMLVLLSYVIYGHHSKIKDLTWFNITNQKILRTVYFIYNILNETILTNKEFRKKINKLKRHVKNLQESLKKSENGIFSSFYNYCYSLLTVSDIIASSHSKSYKIDFNKNNNRINDKLLKKMHDTFYNSSINNLSNNEIKNLDGINKLRHEMYVESSNTLNNSLITNSHIFYLNMPTGGGKTNTSMRLALDIIEKTDANRIIYAMPFINIINQNYSFIRDNFGLEDDVSIRNISSSNSLIFGKDKNNDFVSEVIMNDDFLDFPVICTTFVRLFNTLVNNNKKNKLALISLSNSVIILDEVQSLPLRNWSSLYYIINEISEKYNIYFIFMSATLPDFNKLDNMFQKYQYVKLIENPKKYYDSKYFKNRNKIMNVPERLSFSNKYEVEHYLINVIKSNFEDNFNKGLIVLNTIKSSKIIFELLKKYAGEYNFDLDLLNSTILSTNKDIIIEKINKMQNNMDRYILISTQSIEAGVDVSFNFVIRDFATLDSIEQIRGRCNRNYELSKVNSEIKGRVYIIHLFDENNKDFCSKIYNDEEKLTRLKETSILLIENGNIDYSFIDMEEYYKNISLLKNKITQEKHDKLEPNDKFNIERWNEIQYSKFRKKNGIHIIEDNMQTTLYISTDIHVKYFNDNEINYLRNLENNLDYSLIIDNEVIGSNILKYYDSMIKKNYSLNKKKIIKKQFNSIISKFFINTYITNDLEKEYIGNESYNMENKEYYFFKVIPNDLIGDEKDKIYSLKFGINSEYKSIEDFSKRWL